MSENPPSDDDWFLGRISSGLILSHAPADARAARDARDLEEWMHDALDRIREARTRLRGVGPADGRSAEMLRAADEALCSLLPGAEPFRWNLS